MHLDGHLLASCGLDNQGMLWNLEGAAEEAMAVSETAAGNRSFKVTNLLNYPLTYLFAPRGGLMAHEERLIGRMEGSFWADGPGREGQAGGQLAWRRRGTEEADEGSALYWEDQEAKE